MTNYERNPKAKAPNASPGKIVHFFGFRYSSLFRISDFGFRALFVIALAALFIATSSVSPAAEPLRALLITGGCCHDYEAQKKILSEGISARANVTWTILHEGDAAGKTHEFS